MWCCFEAVIRDWALVIRKSEGLLTFRIQNHESRITALTACHVGVCA